MKRLPQTLPKPGTISSFTCFQNGLGTRPIDAFSGTAMASPGATGTGPVKPLAKRITAI
jgi:hypothetical protein